MDVEGVASRKRAQSYSESDPKRMREGDLERKQQKVAGKTETNRKSGKSKKGKQESDAGQEWSRVTHRRQKSADGVGVNVVSKPKPKQARGASTRSRPRWGLHLTLVRSEPTSIRKLGTELDSVLPKDTRYTVRQTEANTFILSPPTSEDNFALLKVLKTAIPEGIFGGDKHHLKVPEDQRMPKQKSFGVIVKGLDRWTSDEDIKSELTDQGFRGVLRVDRFQRNGQFMPLCRIELSSEKDAKTLLDNGLHVGHARFRCEPPHIRQEPVQCYGCNRFGHKKVDCKATATCLVCGDPQHIDKGEKCDRIRKCSNCGGAHLALYKGCPMYRTAVVEQHATVPKVQKSTSYARAANKEVPLKAANTASPAHPLSQPQLTIKEQVEAEVIRREEEFISKIASIFGGILQQLLGNGFILNRDPTRIGAQGVHDIEGIVHKEVRKQLSVPPSGSGEHITADDRVEGGKLAAKDRVEDGEPPPDHSDRMASVLLSNDNTDHSSQSALNESFSSVASMSNHDG